MSFYTILDVKIVIIENNKYRHYARVVKGVYCILFVLFLTRILKGREEKVKCRHLHDCKLTTIRNLLLGFYSNIK